MCSNDTEELERLIGTSEPLDYVRYVLRIFLDKTKVFYELWCQSDLYLSRVQARQYWKIGWVHWDNICEQYAWLAMKLICSHSVWLLNIVKSPRTHYKMHGDNQLRCHQRLFTFCCSSVKETTDFVSNWNKKNACVTIIRSQ